MAYVILAQTDIASKSKLITRNVNWQMLIVSQQFAITKQTETIPKQNKNVFVVFLDRLSITYFQYGAVQSRDRNDTSTRTRNFESESS